VVPFLLLDLGLEDDPFDDSPLLNRLLALDDDELA